MIKNMKRTCEKCDKWLTAGEIAGGEYGRCQCYDHRDERPRTTHKNKRCDIPFTDQEYKDQV